MQNINRILILSVLGSITLLPLLVLPVMVGGLIDYIEMSQSVAGWAASMGFLGGALVAILISLRIHHLDLRRLAWGGLTIMLNSSLKA